MGVPLTLLLPKCDFGVWGLFWGNLGVWDVGVLLTLFPQV